MIDTNKASFLVKLWGVRGSLPTPETPEEKQKKIANAIKDFIESGYQSPADIDNFIKNYPNHLCGGYGGNTTCVEVFKGSQSLIIDGGSGLRKKALDLMSGPCAQGQGEVHILMTHFHWDHLIGLPFFTPLFIKGNRINFYAVQNNLGHAIRDVFKKPYFPVEFDALASNIRFHHLKEREAVEIEGFQVTPYQLDHPDPCWGFKIQKDGATYSHCVDTEFTRATEEELGPDLPLYQNVDLMVFDAQYTIKEATEKVNWGHAAASFGIDIAMREGVKKILFVHHDPNASDRKIKMTEHEVRSYYLSLTDQLKKNDMPFNPVEWQFAIEDQLFPVIPHF
jgi:phosphoribosyl 1,2-cyclic phosphodiesterase